MVKIVLTFFFLLTCFTSVTAEMERPIYVRHITSILPKPTMKVGGTTVKYRPTLHWSILGLEPPMGTVTTNQSTGVEIKTEWENGFEEREYPYAIIERLDNLSEKMVGGIPLDIYTLGEHTPSENSYIFIPEDEKDKVDLSIYQGTVIFYDPLLGNIKETVTNFSIKKGFLRVWLSVIGIPGEGFKPESELSQVLVDLVGNFKDTKEIKLASKEILAAALHTGKFKATSLYRICGTKGEQTKYNCFKASSGGAIYYIYYLTGNHPTLSPGTLMRMHLRYDSNVSRMLMMDNGEVVNYSNYLARLGVESSLIGWSHGESGIYDAEREILQIMPQLKQLNYFGCRTQARLKQEFTKKTESLLKNVPTRHKNEMMLWFMDCYMRRVFQYLIKQGIKTVSATDGFAQF